MNKVNYLTTLAYVKAKNFVSDFKNDERGLDAIVIAIILIGIALLVAIVFKDALIGEDGILPALIDKIKDTLGLGEE